MKLFPLRPTTLAGLGFGWTCAFMPLPIFLSCLTRGEPLHSQEPEKVYSNVYFNFFFISIIRPTHLCPLRWGRKKQRLDYIKGEIIASKNSSCTNTWVLATTPLAADAGNVGVGRSNKRFQGFKTQINPETSLSRHYYLIIIQEEAAFLPL